MNPFPNYPGAKSQMGVAERIISQMPPHRVYVEAFLGGGSVMRKKRPAKLNIGIDKDPGVIHKWTWQMKHLPVASGARPGARRGSRARRGSPDPAAGAPERRGQETRAERGGNPALGAGLLTPPPAPLTLAAVNDGIGEGPEVQKVLENKAGV